MECSYFIPDWKKHPDTLSLREVCYKHSSEIFEVKINFRSSRDTRSANFYVDIMNKKYVKETLTAYGHETFIKLDRLFLFGSTFYWNEEDAFVSRSSEVVENWKKNPSTYRISWKIDETFTAIFYQGNRK